MSKPTKEAIIRAIDIQLGWMEILLSTGLHENETPETIAAMQHDYKRLRNRKKKLLAPPPPKPARKSKAVPAVQETERTVTVVPTPPGLQQISDIRKRSNR